MSRPKTLTPAQRIANQSKYNKAYKNEFYRTMAVSFDKRTSSDVIDWLDAQPNKTQAIIALIRKELNNNSK